MHTIAQAPSRHAVPEPQKVVVVNGTPEVLELLETILEAGRYDMVFVESSGHAYSRIKHVQPDLVILCMDLTELEGFHLLSMLKLDDDTRAIPVVTYTGDRDTSNDDEDDDESMVGDEFTITRPTIMMN
jgi:adenylate cyclase